MSKKKENEKVEYNWQDDIGQAPTKAQEVAPDYKTMYEIEKENVGHLEDLVRMLNAEKEEVQSLLSEYRKENRELASSEQKYRIAFELLIENLKK